MAITATSITPDNTLEEFRIQFNKLVTDVDGVASGNTFTQSIIFEGATADESETTLLATDPTADRTITLPDATGTVITTGNSADPATETTVGNVSNILVDVSGTLKKISRTDLGLGSSAADDITTGDAAVTLATSTGNITIDAQGSDTDIIFKGTDDASDITALTLDMSDAGTAIFNHDIKIADGGFIGSASDADAIGISAGGDVSLTGGGLSLIDNEKIILGTNSDISFTYDESSTDSLVISSDVDDAALGIIFQADAGADAGD